MGSTLSPKTFPSGIHVPCLTWFSNDKTQEVDWDLQSKHLEFLVSSGLHGSTSFPCTLHIGKGTIKQKKDMHRSD